MALLAQLGRGERTGSATPLDPPSPTVPRAAAVTVSASQPAATRDALAAAPVAPPALRAGAPASLPGYLPASPTTIADYGRSTILELDSRGIVLSKLEGFLGLKDAQRLPSGNLLVTELLPGLRAVARLDTGNTLVTLGGAQRVVELTSTGAEFWKLEHLREPSSAQRLRNGHTLVAERGGVREFDARGAVVWSAPAECAVSASR